MNFNQRLENILKTCAEFCDQDGQLLKQNIKHSAEQFDDELIALLINNPDTKAHFFKSVGKATVFNYRKFIDYIEDKNFLLDSYTKFANKVGLTISNKYIKAIDDVVLSFPFKDCVLEGGQSKDDEKRKEIFFNEVLAKDEINRLLDKKVITNAKKYSQNGTSDEVSFKRDENGTIKDNLIIKGNNLLALHTLKSNFAGKVKLIYIDPPYNTGNDSFNYNDNFNHSTWLVFMKNRLEVARELLSDDGVIFVQCDDNEQAYLKVLMDEVFGRGNFVGTLIHQRAKGGGNAKHIVKGHDYVSIYAKSLSSENKFIREKVIQSKVIDIDGKSYIRDDDVVRKTFGKYDKNLDRRCFYDELVKYKNEKQIKDIKNKIKNEEYVLENFGNGRQVIVKYTLVENSYSKIYSIVKALSENGNMEISNLKLNFDNPKPEAIMLFLINSVTQKGDIVLDYHLGSGTTVAVAHKMGRQYIGIEQMDYIEDIAVKRMQKVIGKPTKKTSEIFESMDFDNGGISKSVDWQGGGEFIYFELDKYNQAYIDNLNAIKAGHSTKKTIEKLYDEIAQHAFLNYDVDSKKLLTNKTDFVALSLDNQLEFLFSILNKNQLYKNLSEIDDKDFGVNDKIKRLNGDFYG